MDIEPYNDEFKRNALVRERKFHKDTCHTLRFGDRTENERVYNEIEKMKLLDFTEKNNKMNHFPEWKENKQSKFMSSKGFNNKLGNIRIENSCWEPVPFREHGQDFNPYKGGNKEIGDVFCFKNRIPEKEMDPDNEFRGETRPDLWESCLGTSQTIRTMMNDKVLKFDPVYDNFSKNDHLEYYKQSLVKTKNVDRIIPFRHSNNYRGDSMQELRPMQEKIYAISNQEQVRRAFLYKKLKSQQDPTLKRADSLFVKSFKHEESIHLPNDKSPKLGSSKRPPTMNLGKVRGEDGKSMRRIDSTKQVKKGLYMSETDVNQGSEFYGDARPSSFRINQDSKITNTASKRRQYKKIDEGEHIINTIKKYFKP